MTDRRYRIGLLWLVVPLACSSNGAATNAKDAATMTTEAGAGDDAGATPDADATAPDAVASTDGSTPETSAPDAATEASAPVMPHGPTGAWKLVWSDEFDGTALDPGKWNSGWLTAPSSPGHGNITAVTDSQQSGTYFGPAAFSFPGDGALHIRLSAPVDPGAPTGFSTRESGLITTAGLWNLNPASSSYAGAGQSIDGTQVIEIRARLAGPASDGAAYWPAFWMTNAGNYNGGGQSYSEEVDFLEGLGNGSTGKNLEFHLHAASEYGSGNSVVPASAQSTDFSLAYHTYTFSLSTSAIQCWSDGTLVPTVSPSATQVSAQWSSPQYLMLAFQATTGAVLPTSATGQPSDLMLDYVRIWTP
jgi:hypothetical protein